MLKKKRKEEIQSNYLHRDCLPILMPLYIIPSYLMLFTALFNAVCLYNAFFAIDFFKCFFVFMLCLGLLTQFVYFKYYFASCTVLLIRLFS